MGDNMKYLLITAVCFALTACEAGVYMPLSATGTDTLSTFLRQSGASIKDRPQASALYKVDKNRFNQ